MIFLRNTSFGSEYNFSVTDPATNKKFDITLQLEELKYSKDDNKHIILSKIDRDIPKYEGRRKKERNIIKMFN